MLLSGMILPNVVSGYTQRAPDAHVGDLLRFEPASAPDHTPAPVVPAQNIGNVLANPGAKCILDVAVMRNPGAAMSVLAVRADGVVLTWAGKTTANSQGCTPGASVFIAAENYDVLAMAARPSHPFNRGYRH